MTFSETPQSSVNFPTGHLYQVLRYPRLRDRVGVYKPRWGSGGGRRRRSMSEENKALARRSWESVDAPDTLGEVYASDVVWHMPDQEV